MSKTLSYAKLTAYAEQAMRDHLTDAAQHRDAGAAERASCALAAAAAVHRMWEALVLQHLDAYSRRSFTGDFTRLETLMSPVNDAPGTRPK